LTQTKYLPSDSSWITCYFWIFLICLLLLIAENARGAELNVSRNQLPVSLGPYLDHFEDPDRTLTIEDILAGDLPWERSTQNIHTLGMSGSAHWFHINLKGENLGDESLLLSLEAPVLDRVEFYFVRNNELVRTSIAGDTIPYSALDYPYRFPVILFNAGSTRMDIQIYLRATSGGGVEIPLKLTTLPELSTQQQAHQAFLGALFALFIVCLVVCAGIYTFTKDKNLIGTLMFFGGAILFFLGQTGMGRVWFWGETSEFNTRVSMLAANILVASICKIGISLDYKMPGKKLLKQILRGCAWLMLPAALFYSMAPFSAIGASTVAPMMIIAFLIAIAVLLMAGITALQGSRAAVYLFFPC